MKTPTAFNLGLQGSLLLLSTLGCLAQPQEAWVARYSGGFTNKNHAPLAVKLDAAGNIYIAGTSQNASNLSDYVVLKYAPNGTQLYATRFGSTNGENYAVNGFTLDQNGNTYLTGTGGTVKCNGSGGVVWTVQYAGNDVAVDTNGNVYVTGFSALEYATVKLDAAGSNQWVRTFAVFDHSESGSPVAVSQRVAVDHVGNIYVAGWADRSAWYDHGSTNAHYYASPFLLKYNATGDCLWTNDYMGGGQNWGETKGLIADSQGNVYVTGISELYTTVKILASGQTAWNSINPPAGDVVLDACGYVYVTGRAVSGFAYGTKKLDNSGNLVWKTYYFGTSSGYTYNQAYSLALDEAANVHVTGVSTNTGSGNDFATIKYNSNGNQQWLIRYNGAANGNDGATGIAVAPDGSIYVTGYSANEFGGSDIVLIKYVMPATIQKKTDGSMQLQGYGLPSSNYTFQAATNLLNWDAIGSSIADTNGLFQLTDTNAPLFPYRFYRWTQP